MNKKPEIFKPNMDFIDNNEKTYYSYLENKTNKVEKKAPEDIHSFIDKLSKNSYVFNKKVIIKTKEKNYETKIAGKIGNRLITIDSDSININDIVEIYEK